MPKKNTRGQFFGVLLAAMLIAPVVESTPMGIMVPAYFPPSQATYWGELDFAASRVPLIAIMNPNSGPGTSKSTSYVGALSQLHQAGGTVIGYVYTSKGTRALSAVETDIDTYLSWYDVNGFFLDEMANDANTNDYNYYETVYQYIKSKGNYTVTGNPGANTEESYISIPTVDMVMDFEGYGTNYPNWAPSSWTYEYPAERFVNLPHYVTSATLMTNYIDLAAGRNAGWVYVGDNVYSDIPSYWTNEVNLVQSLNEPSVLPTITDPALPADQTPILGNPITFRVAASGQMPLLYQWFFGTNAIPDATNLSYTIPSVQLTNVGSYYAQISNSIGSTNSRSALLTTINTNASTYANILIDGSFDDWSNVPLAYSQAQPTGDVVAFQDLYVANDENYLYIRFSLYNSTNPFVSKENIFIDTDDNAMTGYSEHGIGSEMLIQGGAGYQETNGIFNDGTISGLSWLASPTGVGTNFEVRISRNATYANGTPVFTNNTIAIFLESSESAGNEWFPNITGGLTYTFAPKLVTLTPLSISYSAEQILISWVGTGTLQSCASLTNGGNWNNVPNANNPYAATPTNSQQFFRLMP